MTIQKVKERLEMTDKDIADAFGYASSNSYANAHRKKKLDKGIVEIYNRTIKSIKNKQS